MTMLVVCGRITVITKGTTPKPVLDTNIIVPGMQPFREVLCVCIRIERGEGSLSRFNWLCSASGCIQIVASVDRLFVDFSYRQSPSFVPFSNSDSVRSS
jgi:hypothetical protein